MNSTSQIRDQAEPPVFRAGDGNRTMEVEAVLACLSAARVAPYRAAFAPSAPHELLGCYLWAQALSASLHPFVGLFEVVLRNAIHRSLSLQVSGRTSESYPWYDRALPGALALHGKSLVRIEELLTEGVPPIRKRAVPTPDAVVASLSFGFWPNLLEGLSNRFAPRTFSDVFSHHPHSKPQHWSHGTNRRVVVDRLKKLQQLRNRVCHFEPVWKLHALAPSQAMGKHWSHAVAAIRRHHADLLELLGWCSPDSVQSYKSSFAWSWFNRLCTTAAVSSFMTDHTTSAHLVSMASRTEPGASR